MYNDRIRIHDRTNAFTYAVQGNRENFPIILNFLYNNFQRIRDTYGGPARLTIAINALAAFMRNFTHISEFQAWVYRNQIALGDSFSAGVGVVSTGIANLEWSNNVALELLTVIRGFTSSASAITMPTVLLIVGVAINYFNR
ncbi:unnamed protein product, partial [Iphiclides podalirius]